MSGGEEEAGKWGSGEAGVFIITLRSLPSVPKSVGIV